MKIGIIGAGRLGQALARRLVGAGHEVMLSNSRGHDAVREIARTVGCLGGSAEDAAAFGEIAVVSVPLSAFSRLPVDAIGAKITMDTCNFYPARDGAHPELEGGGETTSGLLQKALAKAIVVKAFNSVLAPHLAKGGAAPADGARHALPTASDDADAAALVAGWWTARVLNPYSPDRSARAGGSSGRGRVIAASSAPPRFARSWLRRNLTVSSPRVLGAADPTRGLSLRRSSFQPMQHQTTFFKCPK